MAKTRPRKIAISDLTFAPRFEYGDMAQVAQITGADDGSKLGTGLGRMVNAEIPWTVHYDEVLMVLDGELTVRTRDGDFTIGPHEFVWLPDGTELTYITENALIFYCIHPTDWAERA